MKKSKVLSVVYFGGSAGMYLDGELTMYRGYQAGGEFDLWCKTLDILKTEDISEVKKYMISDESDFWDTVEYSGGDWEVPDELSQIMKNCEEVE